ncbi:MAG: DUF2321 domain-containing protein [Defluviitaleaceae bacterium]|nr:DUF2321 domain-containing protein [Defluviitaleaceae bacterium]
MNCSKCKKSLEKEYQGKPVEYCEYCGNKLIDNCPYCDKAVKGQFYHGEWIQCELCNFPVLKCDNCDIVYSINEHSCAECGKELKNNNSKFLPKLVNDSRSNIYNVDKILEEAQIGLKDNLSYDATSAPLALNNLFYFWAAPNKNKNTWHLNYIDIFSGSVKCFSESEIQCPRNEKISIEIFGNFLLSVTQTRLWIHEASSGVEICSKIIGAPFVAHIDKNYTLIILKYDERISENGKEFVYIYPGIDSGFAFDKETEIYNKDTRSSDNIYTSILVRPIESDKMIYIASFDTGIILLEKPNENNKNYQCNLCPSEVLKEKKICQLADKDDLIFFTFINDSFDSWHWGTYSPDTRNVVIHENISLFHHNIGFFNENIVFCEEKGGKKYLSMYHLIDGRLSLGGSPQSKDLFNSEIFLGFSLVEYQNRQYCIYYHKAARLNSYSISHFQFDGESLNSVNHKSSTSLDLEDVHYVCICNYLITFSRPSDKDTIIKIIKIFSSF